MPEEMQWAQLVIVAVVGFVAGIFGGVLGVGGASVIIPGLTFAFGFNQHVYQAAALIGTVALSVPSAWRHRRSGSMIRSVIVWMFISSLIAVCIGVAISNLPIFRGEQSELWLGRGLACFLVYVIYDNVRRLTGHWHEPKVDDHHVTPARSASVGALAGFLTGLLGVGGGGVLLPFQQVLLRLPLRTCIANSAVIVCTSSAIGAIYKTASLGLHDKRWHEAAFYGLLLAPTAALGGRLGASLTSRLPLRQVRAAFVILMAFASWRMAAIPWPTW